MTQALAQREPTPIAPTAQFSTDQIDLIRRTVARGTSKDQLDLFLYTARSRGLDPLLRQIHAVVRQGEMAIQVGIDGYRLIADRTGKYAGNDDAIFEEGTIYPSSATVTVWKLIDGQRYPFTATARWDEYYPGDKQAFMWKKMPHTMLAKCAEGLALRKAFPAELGGMYIPEEMAQAGREDAPRQVVEAEYTEVEQPPVETRAAPKSSAPAKAPPPRIERITEPDDPTWQRWLERVATAHALGLEYPDLDLPIRYGDLVAHGTKLKADIEKRQQDIEALQPADDAQAVPASGRSQFDELYAEIESLCDTAIEIDAEAVEWPWRTREDATIELLIDTIQKQKQAIVDRNAQLDEQKRQERKAAGAAR